MNTEKILKEFFRNFMKKHLSIFNWTMIENYLISLEMRRKKKQYWSDFKFYLLMGVIFLVAMLMLYYLINKI